MPEVVFVSTLEPKDGRHDELVELLARPREAYPWRTGLPAVFGPPPARRGQGPAPRHPEVHLARGVPRARLQWARGQAPGWASSFATPPAPPVLFEPVPLGDDAAK